MLSPIALLLLVSSALYVVKLYTQFARNLAAAKKSGIPYVMVPCYQQNRLFQLSQALVLPILRMFPISWTQPWLALSLEWGWHLKYEPFKRLGTDTFLAVSPGRNMLYTASAEVISQITSRKNDFPKPLEVYATLTMYGNNVVTSEGQLWRHHRKIASPPFSEKNNHLVWTEALEQCQAMVNGWFEGNTAKTESRTVYTIADDAMRLSLYVISRAGFGVHLQWPGIGDAHTKKPVKHKTESSAEVAQGMSYTDALGLVLHEFLLLFLVPRLLLSNSMTRPHILGSANLL